MRRYHPFQLAFDFSRPVDPLPPPRQERPLRRERRASSISPADVRRPELYPPHDRAVIVPALTQARHDAVERFRQARATDNTQVADLAFERAAACNDALQRLRHPTTGEMIGPRTGFVGGSSGSYA